MSFWTVQWLYVAARSVAALVLIVLMWRDAAGVVYTIGQAIADGAAAVSVLGMTSQGLRAAIGPWWVAIFLYFLGWEAHRAWRRLWPFGADDDITSAGSWGRAGGVFVWETLANAPPLIGGFFLFFDVLFPSSVTFPAA